MSDTFKIGRKPNTITIKRTEMHHEMYTTDIERIKQFIVISDYPDKIDPNVILKINEQAVKLSRQEYSYYFDNLESEEQTMLWLFENIIKADRKIGNILKKIIDPEAPCTDKELIYLMQWESGNHGYYWSRKRIESRQNFLVYSNNESTQKPESKSN